MLNHGRLRFAACLIVLASAVFAAPAHAAKGRTVDGELRALVRSGAIDQAEYRERRAAYVSARGVARKLTGVRRRELTAVLDTILAIARRGQLSASRLTPLWLIVQRNREWWTRRPLLRSGARVSFPGSELVFQYYPGQGLQLQPLASFGKLNGLWEGKRYDTRLARLLDELLALAVRRGDGVAWEYYFRFGSPAGRPPWVSGMAQATALQALARAGIRLQRRDEVLTVARQGLRLFHSPPPTGVRVPATGGAGGVHYLLYSYDRRMRVLNAFAQSLVGLYDFAGYANDDDARALFASGDRGLRAEAPAFDTGAWSLYARRGTEATLNYHQLNGQFLGQLCKRTDEQEYCALSQRFGGYLRQPPKLQLVSRRLRGGTRAQLRVRVSKVSRVALTIVQGSKIVHTDSAQLAHGTRSFSWAPPKRAGRYALRLDATDLAGNRAQLRGEIEVLAPKRKAKK